MTPRPPVALDDGTHWLADADTQPTDAAACRYGGSTMEAYRARRWRGARTPTRALSARRRLRELCATPPTCALAWMARTRARQRRPARGGDEGPSCRWASSRGARASAAARPDSTRSWAPRAPLSRRTRPRRASWRTRLLRPWTRARARRGTRASATASTCPHAAGARRTSRARRRFATCATTGALPTRRIRATSLAPSGARAPYRLLRCLRSRHHLRCHHLRCHPPRDHRPRNHLPLHHLLHRHRPPDRRPHDHLPRDHPRQRVRRRARAPRGAGVLRRRARRVRGAARALSRAGMLRGVVETHVRSLTSTRAACAPRRGGRAGRGACARRCAWRTARTRAGESRARRRACACARSRSST